MAAVKKNAAKHKAEDEYLLTTKLYCGTCGRFMVGECGTSKTGGTYRYYKCIGNKKRLGCDKKSIHKEQIENLVINEIKKNLFDDELISRLTDMIMEKQNEENTVIPVLKRNPSATEKSISNMLNAIQMGIITESTKERLQQLEKQKKEIEMSIAKEEISHPTLSREQIQFWFERMRKYDTTKLEHRRKRIDIFVNAIYVYDDKILLTFNYKDGTETITNKEIEEFIKGSDTSSLAPPKNKRGTKRCLVFLAQRKVLC